jgi:hypothetical protein
MGFYDVAESKLLYVCVILGILYVVGISLYYFYRCYKRALEIGIAKETLTNVIKSSVSFSIIPSIAIVTGLVSLTAMIGIPWAWLRLSVIGSVSYEIMAADMALKTMNLDLNTATAYAFGLVMFAMSIGISGGPVFNIFAVEKIHMGTVKLKVKDPSWGPLVSTIFMTAMLVVFLVPIILAGGANLMTLVTSIALTILLSYIIKKTQKLWLSNFVLVISLLGAMASSILWEKLFSML